MKTKTTLFIRPVLAAALTAGLLCSCGTSSGELSPSSAPNSETESSAPEVPAFDLRKSLVAVEDTTNLYFFTPEVMQDTYFFDVQELGDYLLLICDQYEEDDRSEAAGQEFPSSDSAESSESTGETSVISEGSSDDIQEASITSEDSLVDNETASASADASSSAIEETSETVDDYYPGEDFDGGYVEYPCIRSFYLYDPLSDQVIAVLSDIDGNSTGYIVSGDRLLIQDYTNYEVSIYNASLEYEEAYRIPFLFEDCSNNLISVPGSDYAYDCTYESDQLVRFDLRDMSYETFDLNLYSPRVVALSEDGRRIAVSGTGKDSLQTTTLFLDTEDFEVYDTLEGYVWLIRLLTDDSRMIEYEDALWEYDISDEEPLFFENPCDTSVYSLPDASFIALSGEYLEEEECWCYRGMHYDTDGQLLSAFSFPDHDYASPYSNGIYLEEENCLLFPALNAEGNSTFLVWDLAAAYDQPEQPLEFYDSLELLKTHGYIPPEPGTYNEDGTTLTMIPDTTEYDWGNLSEINERANVLEETYGITIYLGEEVPPLIDVYHADAELDPEVMDTAMNAFENLITAYPENFFEQLCFGDCENILFYLAGDLYGEADGMIDDPAAFVSEINHNLVMVLDCTQSFNWEYTFNHELSHMIDRRLAYQAQYEDSLFSDADWCSYNPNDFDYLYTYDDYWESEGYDCYPEYFMDSYGTTYPTEDRAELFGSAMEQYYGSYDWQGLFESDSPTYPKFEYYCKCIREGFHTDGWEDVMPWEKVLN